MINYFLRGRRLKHVSACRQTCLISSLALLNSEKNTFLYNIAKVTETVYFMLVSSLI